MLSGACCVFTINSRSQKATCGGIEGCGGGGISYIILTVEGEEAEVVKNKNQLHKSGPRRTSQQV